MPDLTSILLDRPNLPPLLQLALPRPQAGPVAPTVPQRAPQGPGGFTGAVSRIFGGAPDPNLSAAGNEEARRQALLTAGLTMLAGQGQAPPMAVIAQGAMAGMSAGNQLRERLRQKAAMKQALGMMPPEQQAVFGALPPELQQQVIAKLMTDPPKGIDPKVVGKALVGPDGTVIYRDPEAPAELPSELRGLAFSMGINLDKATPADLERLNKAWFDFTKSRGTNVNVDARPPVQKATEEELMKSFATARTTAEGAATQMETLDIMESLLRDPQMATGRVEDLTMAGRQLLAGLGFGNTEKLSVQEVFRALSNKMSLAARSAGLTGPMSDNDIKFLKEMVPRLANTRSGNLMLIEISRRLAQRQRSRAIEMERYLTEKDSPRGMMAHMEEWDKSNAVDLSDLRTQALGEFGGLVGG